MKRFFLLPVVLCLLACGLSCSDSSGTDNSIPTTEKSDFTDEALHWADSLLSTMTVEECVGQLLMPAIYAGSDPSTLRLADTYATDLHVGGIVLLKGDTRSATEISRRMNAHSPSGCWIAIDAEWGLAMRLSDAPAFPANADISVFADEQLMYDYGREVAHEARSVGINMLLGPVADVAPAGHSGILGRRTLGNDPIRVASLATAYALGAESAGVITVAKHFPGHGRASADSHNKLSEVRTERSELDSVDLLPFKSIVSNNLSAIMIGHIAVPSLDGTLRPATSSRRIMHDLLRDSLGFKGLILTDALNMKGASGTGAAEALLAGADIVVAPADTRSEFRNLMKAVADGSFPLWLLQEKCRRILFYKYKSRLYTRHSHPTAPQLHSPRSEEIARRLRTGK